MSEPSRLVDLATSIQFQVTAIHKALAAAGQPDPTFDANDVPANFDVPGVQDLRTAVLEQIEDLHDLLMTPFEGLLGVTTTDYMSRHALDRFNVYDLVPIGETRTYTELAEFTGLPTPTIRRLIRHAMTQRIFTEPSPGVVAHTATSKFLTENLAARDYCATVSQMVFPAAARATHALQRWPKESGSMDRTKTGFVLAHGKTNYQFLADDPEQNRRYDNALGISRYDMSYSVEHLAKGFDWESLGSGTIVDVAGGVGNVSLELAKRFPKLNFIVQDRPGVIAGAKLDNEAEDVKKRVRYMAHDMFTPQPIKHAGVYFFRRVFMEWPDDKAIEILRNLIPALQPNRSRVVIADFYVPEPGNIARWQERRFRNTDLLSLALANGASRDQEEWKELFKKASPGYVVEKISPLKNSDMIVTEAVWSAERA